MRVREKGDKMEAKEVLKVLERKLSLLASKRIVPKYIVLDIESYNILKSNSFYYNVFFQINGNCEEMLIGYILIIRYCKYTCISVVGDELC